MLDWEENVCKTFSLESIREHQRKAIQSLLDGQDVFLSLRTGGGKSLPFMSFPIAAAAQRRKRACGPTGEEFVLVVSPLNCIMSEQEAQLHALGFGAVCLGKDITQKPKILQGEYQFVFTSPENILQSWRGMLRSPEYLSKVGLIVIDEAHTIIQWGSAGSKEDSPFREWFSQLGELRSLLPNTPMLAMTATASKQRRKKIQTSLGMKNCVEIVDNPNRENIKLTVQNVHSNAPYKESFQWVLDLLKENGSRCPRLLIFCKSIDDCARIYFVCKRYLPKVLVKHVDMYHSQSPEKTKLRIREDMAEVCGYVRVLICTNAAGMGVNFAGVDNVVNFGPPQEMDTLLQQLGRAGRTGDQAHHVLIYNNRQLRNVDAEVLNFVRNPEHMCRRQIMLTQYSAVCDPTRTLHACCDICATSCDCKVPECSTCISIVETTQIQEAGDDDGGPTVVCTPITADQKRSLQLSLEEYRLQLNESAMAGCFHLVPELTHGFTQNVINCITDKCSCMKSADDVLAICGVWSYDQAQVVYEILCSVLERDCVTMGDYDYREDDDGFLSV